MKQSFIVENGSRAGSYTIEKLTGGSRKYVVKKDGSVDESGDQKGIMAEYLLELCSKDVTVKENMEKTNPGMYEYFMERHEQENGPASTKFNTNVIGDFLFSLLK